jgi:hypothetical protein
LEILAHSNEVLKLEYSAKPAPRPAPGLASGGGHNGAAGPSQIARIGKLSPNYTPFPDYNPSRLVGGEYRSPQQYIFGKFGYVGNLELINSVPKHLCLERLQGVDKNIDDSNLLEGQEKKLEKNT